MIATELKSVVQLTEAVNSNVGGDSDGGAKRNRTRGPASNEEEVRKGRGAGGHKSE
jgi:hypothetical protein